jgi:hypothetical protein
MIVCAFERMFLNLSEMLNVPFLSSLRLKCQEFRQEGFVPGLPEKEDPSDRIGVWPYDRTGSFGMKTMDIDGDCEKSDSL